MRRCIIAIVSIASLIISCFVQSNAQPDPNNFIPPSPNTASLGQYGRVDVGLNTGRVNVSIPLHQIKLKDLQLSVDLSYGGGGIKVEEAATWVGLGWSLNAGGVITREVRGLPDEYGGGLMNSTYPIYLEGASLDDDAKDALWEVLQGRADMEPDMFYFNFAGQAGRFVYDQSTQKFVTIPKSKKIITYDGIDHWTIVTEDGAKYAFAQPERNTTTGCSPTSKMTTTGWYLTTMENANSTELITFAYASDVYSFNLLSPKTKGYVLAPPACSFLPSDIGPPCYQQNQIISQRLTSITYPGGHADFIAQVDDRCDLTGDYALEHIDIYNENEDKFLTYNFHDSYFTSSGSSATACSHQPEESRLRLDSITRTAGGMTELYRKLEYATPFMPSRYSLAQDYWGYYNGQLNTDLIPTVYLPTSTGIRKFTGANRDASTNLSVSQAGMLSRVYYPTRGYTEFQYENHRIDGEGTVVTDYQTNKFLFQGYGKPGPRFDTTFVINEPPSALNNNNPNGGAYVTFKIEGISCDYGPPARTGCAELGFTGPQGATLTGDITEQDGYYMQNGTYTFTANFTSNPNTLDWMEFYVTIAWQQEITVNKDNSAIGGLRIKRVTDVDPFEVTTRQQDFTYTLEDQPTKSSAYVKDPMTFGRMVSHKAQCGINVHGGDGVPTDLRTCERYELTAGSNYPTIGVEEAVTYSFVTVTEDVLGKGGKTTHEFMTYPDMVYNFFPYTPSVRYDWKRGQPSHVKEYKRVGANYSLLKDTKYTYKVIGEYKMYGCRVANNIICADGFGSKDWFDYGGYYIWETYDIANGYFHNDSIVTRVYDDVRAVASYEFKTLDETNLVVRRSETTDDRNNKLVTWYKYAANYPSGYGGIAQQRAKNINNLIEKTTWQRSGTDSTLVSAALSLYDIQAGNIVYRKSMQRLGPGSFTPSYVSSGFHYDPGYIDQVTFVDYDGAANPTTYVERNGVQNAIYWSTNQLYPIATAVNAARSNIFYTSFEHETTGTTETSITGEHYYSGATYQIPSADRPSGSNLKMTYWYFSSVSNKWVFKTEVPYSYSIAEPNATRYDELRVYPAGSQMTTYSYHPGIGVISTNDLNNRVTHYEYDPFGRLVVVRDQDGKIVKTYTYHLATGIND